MDNLTSKISYVAKYNKVWKNIKTKEVLGNSIELKENQKISDYEEIPKIKDISEKQKIDNINNLSTKPNLGYSLNKK